VPDGLLAHSWACLQAQLLSEDEDDDDDDDEEESDESEEAPNIFACRFVGDEEGSA